MGIRYNPLLEGEKENAGDQRLQDYLTRMGEQHKDLAPYLLRLDMEALRRVEESFQKELHESLYAIRAGDDDAFHEIHGWMKGARSLMTWIEGKRRVVG